MQDAIDSVYRKFDHFLSLFAFFQNILLTFVIMLKDLKTVETMRQSQLHLQTIAISTLRCNNDLNYILKH